MSGRERRKGLDGEREVAAIWQAAGFEVRGLEGTGDHLLLGHGLVVHQESKRQEVARPWAWWAQASAETPAGAVTVVSFRRSRSPWLSLVETRTLASLLGRKCP